MGLLNNSILPERFLLFWGFALVADKTNLQDMAMLGVVEEAERNGQGQAVS